MSGISVVLSAGSGGVVVPLPGGTANGFLQPSVLATWSFGDDGVVTRNATGAATQTHNWYKPAAAGVGASFYIRATLNSGTAPGGSALNTWLSLSSTRQWSLSANNNQTKSCSLFIQIATDSGGTNIVTSGTYNIEADSNLQ